MSPWRRPERSASPASGSNGSNERKLFFAVEVLGGGRTVGVGTHQRRVVRQGGEA